MEKASAADLPKDTVRQLVLLREIDEILTQGQMRYWLRGGWAVDFMLGRVTRPHEDIDLVTWQLHRRRVHRLLADAGFELVRELPIQTDFLKDGQDVTFVFLERAPDGTITGHGVPEWVWEPAALPDRRCCLHDICARTVGPAHMLLDHLEWEAATGRPPRPKDARTVEHLREIIEKADPK